MSADDDVEQVAFKQRKRLGLALGGGGSRGLAHIGVLQVLEEAGIEVHAVAGTSVGSLVGVAVAAKRSVMEITAVSHRINWHNLARLTWPNRGFISFVPLERFVVNWLGDITFAELKLPFVCNATDALTGEERIFTEGRIAPCVRASSTVPPLVQPCEIDGHLYVDGGIVNNLPIKSVRSLGVDVVLAVNLFGLPSYLPAGREGYFLTVLGHALCKAGDDPDSADVLVRPDLTGYSMLRFHGKQSIQLGREAMEVKLSELKATLA
ncbi:MAG: patatin-like phospholipase family protein [Chloroflexi bacterium]|nr:patatin-like phospholipase family protein [Chloroflexota bacterium]